MSSLQLDRIGSKLLAAELAKDTDLPWHAYSRGKAISPIQVALILKPYGIEPDQLKINNANLKGYKLEWFKVAFESYL